MRLLICHWWQTVPFTLLLLGTAIKADADLTTKHEAGRCAMRGHCGSRGGPQLPCPDNGLAKEPTSEIRQKLVDLCGDKWTDGPVCCNGDQIDTLANSLSVADAIVASCPACQANFYNLFCTFSCSPDQSLFVNVTRTMPKSDKYMVTEVDNLWSNEYGSGLFDSCKDVKFGASNSKAIEIIGGGAKNYSDLLTFLGRERFGGSPFQINFPRPSAGKFPGMKPVSDLAHPCNSTDTKYRCACMDCGSACTELPDVIQKHECHVGALPCLSFAVILIYAIFIALLITAITGHVAYRKHTQNKHERLRLLQDTMIDEDDDEGEIVYQPGMLNRPTRKYHLNTVCNRVFARLGYVCARFPAITISVSLLAVALLSLGWLRFDVETDPVRLWVAPKSAAASEKAFFDKNFGPFFRAEQAFLVNDTTSAGPSPILSYDTLSWWFDIENKVRHLKTAKGNYTLEDVCYNPTGSGCVIQSVSGYFDETGFDEYWDSQIEACANNPFECLPESGLPLQPKLIFAPYNGSVLNTSALVATWVVKNPHAEDTDAVQRAEEWENTFLAYLHSVKEEANKRGLRLSFNAEVSLEQELSQTTNTDAMIVVVSYIVMFLYASIALGSTTVTVGSILRNPAFTLVQSKFMLGVIGILIVLLSVSASVGLFSALGIKVTLIIAEVIPFLVLAVGVDNIFLIVHEFERVNTSYPDEPVEERIAKALGRMGPSILLSATMETFAFALGASVGMPAVRNFAAYAAGAVLINAILQVTMFVSTLALNQRRVEAGRVDCFPCMKVDTAGNNFSNPSYGHEEDSLQSFIRQTYAPALLGKKTKVVIITVFLGLFTAGLALLPSIQLGLDQRIAIPTGSYLINYYNDLYDYFGSGPPVYFVTRELNVTQRHEQQQLCGRFSTCGERSLANTLEAERKRPEVSYIADPAASWVDDFFLWLNPSLDSCCVDPNTYEACFAERTPAWNITLDGMPQGVEYMDYLDRWLQAPTNAECALGGSAAYGDAVVTAPNKLTIHASHFRTYHTPLRSQADFIASYAAARRIAEDIEAANPGVSVFPYSKFYVFFDQYASIVNLTLTLLGSAIAVCFLISTILLGSVRTGFIVSVTVVMTLVDIGGAMAVAGVSLNAVTLVNLVICVGIAVEFCAHIARAFQFPSLRLLNRASSGIAVTPLFAGNGKAPDGTGSATTTQVFRGRDARAWASLTQVGGSVFSGITITKLLGVCVLAFTRSKIFEVYYFRVWLALVIFAASHALIFLPVALSWAGGVDGWVEEEQGRGGLEEDLRARRVGGMRWGGEDADGDSDEGY